MARLVPYLPLNPLLPRPKGDKDAEGMKKQIPSNPRLRASRGYLCSFW